MFKSLLVVALLASGCVKSQVAKGPSTPEKKAKIMEMGYTQFGEWHYAKLRYAGDYIFAVKIEDEGGVLTADCLQTRFEYPTIQTYSGGLDEPQLTWKSCENEFVLSLLNRITKS